MEAPLEVDPNPAPQCLVSLLLDKVIRHQKVFCSRVCFAPRRTFKVIGARSPPNFGVETIDSASKRR